MRVYGGAENEDRDPWGAGTIRDCSCDSDWPNFADFEWCSSYRDRSNSNRLGGTMSDKDNGRLREAIAKGLDRDGSDVSNVLAALKNTPLDYLALVQEAGAFLKDLTFTETPSDPEKISELSPEEVVFATYRANFFEKIRMPVLSDEQLEQLLMRAHELWGQYPSEPLGRWVDWCLWTHLHRRRNSVPITEVIAGEKTAEDLKQSWIDRHQAREERRNLQKVDDYDRYETPDDVPKSVRQVIMSPFIEETEMKEVEIESDGSQGLSEDQRQDST